MKIAIYGDSFGNTELKNIQGDNISRGFAWVELLAKKYDVVNFSESGSSLMYSYELFLKNNKDFDYNIFLVTSENRITVPPHSYLGNWFKHINFSSIELYKNNKYDPDPIKQIQITDTINAIEGYYKFLYNDTHVHITHKLIIDSISNINKNTLIIPCFKTEFINSLSLNDITCHEFSKSNTHYKIHSKYVNFPIVNDENGKWTCGDYRKCHLSEENNLILFDYIDNAIINNQTLLNLNINDFTPILKDYEFYFYMIKFKDNSLPSVKRFNGELNNFVSTL